MYKLVPYTLRDKEWFNKQTNKNLYSSPPWMDCLSETYGFECLLLVNEQNELITAFCNVKDLMGKRLIGLPFSDYLPYDKNVDFSEVRETCLKEFPEHKVILKTNLPASDKEYFTKSKDAVYHEIDISSGKNLKQSKSFKRGVKQAEKNNIKVRFDYSLRAMEDFYKLYHRLRFDKFNIIPQPFSFFKNIWEKMISKDKGVIVEALLDEKVIASMIVLTCGTTAYYKYGCSDREYLDLKPNNILFHELINHFRSSNFNTIDLGLSGSGESYAGLRRWKKSIGGVEKPITYWSYLPENANPDTELLEKNKQKIQDLTGAMVRAGLDASQTSLLSEHIYPLLA